MPTSEQIDHYRTQEYLVIEDALSPKTLAELQAVTERIVAGAADLTTHSDVLDLEPSHTPEQPRVRRIKKPHLVDPFYRELAADPQITDRISQLIGPNIRLRSGGKVNMKSAGYGAPVEWHQDWAFTHTRTTTCWRSVCCSTTRPRKTGRC